MRGFFNLVNLNLSDAEAQAFDRIIHYMASINPDAVEADEVADAMYGFLVQAYNLKMESKDFKRLIREQTSDIYTAMVKTGGAGIPARINFALPDSRAMQWLDESALTFLTKYVNSPELERRVKDYIKKAYLEEGQAIGNNPKAVDAFFQTFKGDLNASKAKVRTIIDTTVSRSRVFGQVNGLRVARAKTFVIAGPDDDKTCSVCREMVGRTFTVESAVSRQDQMIQAGAAAVNDVSPFLKGNMSVDEIANSTDEELEAAGFALPPYHGSCRHRLVVGDFFGDDEELPYTVE